MNYDKDKNLFVSVAMTTYKSKKYVEEQLVSIFSQSRLPDEIIIMDDASPDDTFDYVKEIIKKAPSKIKISVYKNEVNLGFQQNFEQCFQRCSGDVIFSCDADDIWEVNKIEKVLSVFEQDKKVSMVFHDAVIIDGEGTCINESLNQGWDTRKNKIDSEQLVAFEIKRQGCPYGMTMAFTRKLLLYALPFMTEVSHDEWLILCAPLVGKVICLEDKLTRYRRHGANTSGNKLTMMERVKQLNRADWFLNPERINNVFISYDRRYGHMLSATNKKLLDERFAFQNIMIDIASFRIDGRYMLLKLWQNGLYQKFRGTRNTLILDELYLTYHFGSYLKERKKSNEIKKHK